jgi:hypothetical protein
LHLAISILGNDDKFGFSKVIVGLFVFFIALCFGLAAVMDLVIIFKASNICSHVFKVYLIIKFQIHKVYKSSGASFDKARAELTTNLTRYRHRHFIDVASAQQQETTSVEVRSEVAPVQVMPSVATVTQKSKCIETHADFVPQVHHKNITAPASSNFVPASN